jgi:8-oxo-dGTP pyrophosphatase MutT (NUDIX family)
MTAYVRAKEGVKFWVPRRARNKQTYGGMLDNTVAGGISTGEVPFECLVREASEEASLPEDLVREGASCWYGHLLLCPR